MESVLDKALTEIGQDGKFQNRFDILYNVLVAAFWGVTYMNIFLVLVIIPYHCELPEKPANISEDLWKLKHIPKFQDVAGKLEYSSCLIYTDPNKDNQTKGCDKYEYNTTWYQSTVPSENNWVCDKEINVSNVFAYSKIGEVIGSLLFGWLGDVYGRRWTYIISIALIVLGRIISVLGSKSYLWFLCGCFISCFPSWSVMQSLTVISLEIYSSKRRTRSTTLRNVSWTIGVCLMPFLYWWLKDWKLFLIASTAPIVPFMLFSWKMIESPRWLWVEGKPKECLKYLDIIANTNNRKLKESTRNEILTTQPLKDNSIILGPLALFSTWRLSINTVLQLILWVSCTISYTVLTINSAETTIINPFIEFFWQSAVEIPGICLGEWLANHLGRRYASVNAYFTTAAMWTLVLIRKSNADDWFGSWWIGTIITLINRLSTCVTFYTINLFNMELYPTCLRQAGMSLGNVVSSCASGVSSYIIFLGHQVDPRFPALILIGLSLMGMLSSFFLPETLNTKLPETIEDAKTFGKNKRYFRIKRRV